MKKIIYLISLSIVFGSCKNTDEKVKTGFFINGKIKNAESTQISIQEITTTGLIMLDTTTIAGDGSFEFNGNIKEKSFCTIRLPQGDIVLLIDTNSKLILQADAANIEKYTIEGAKENEDLKKLFLLNSNYMAAAKNLETRFAVKENEIPSVDIQNQLRNAFDSLQKAHIKSVKDFTININNSLVPYFATNFLMAETDFDFFKLIDDKLYNQFSQSKYAVELHNKVNELKKTAIGEIAPEITLSDPFGKTISLSSLRGKYVLLDFWASWCGPCRRENPNVVRLYNKYKNKGFDILGVSLDDNRDAWIKAINDDQLLWNHVSDLLKWNSTVVKQFNIEGIPFTVLIDKEGRIIAKNLRGEMLENKLIEVLNN